MSALEPLEQLPAEVERLTATEPVVLVSGPTAIQKDQKKVAAGKAGVAACQADLAPPPAVPAEDIAVPTVSQKKKKAEPSSREPLMSGCPAAAAITATGNWFQWIVGAAAFAAVVWMFQNKRACTAPAGPMASVPPNPQPTAKQPTPVKQLKVSEDPFYMQ